MLLYPSAPTDFFSHLLTLKDITAQALLQLPRNCSWSTKVNSEFSDFFEKQCMADVTKNF